MLGKRAPASKEEVEEGVNVCKHADFPGGVRTVDLTLLWFILIFTCQRRELTSWWQMEKIIYGYALWFDAGWKVVHGK